LHGIHSISSPQIPLDSQCSVLSENQSKCKVSMLFLPLSNYWCWQPQEGPALTLNLQRRQWWSKKHQWPKNPAISFVTFLFLSVLLVFCSCCFVLVVGTGAWAQGHYLSHFFVMGIFEIGSQELFAQSWPWTFTLLISASWVARITGHWRPALVPFVLSSVSGRRTVLGKCVHIKMQKHEMGFAPFT
jgi:hypothetical protein